MKNVWLIAAVTLGCTVGVSLGACSTGSATSTLGAGGSSSSSVVSSSSGVGGSSSSSGVGGGASSSSSSSSSSGAGGSTAQCSKVTTLHPPKLDAGPGTIYCPFSSLTDGGPNQYCLPGTQHCCETPANSTPTTCEPIATACMTGTGYTDWQCEDPVADCSGATPVCCAPGASIGLGTPVGGMACGNFAHTMTKTVCVAAGACTGITLCTSNAECPTGQTCTPFGKAGNDVGGCM